MAVAITSYVRCRPMLPGAYALGGSKREKEILPNRPLTPEV